MAKQRRVFRVCNWSDFPSEVRSGMAVQLRNQIPVVVLKRSKEANDALKKVNKIDELLMAIPEQADLGRALQNCHAPVSNGNNVPVAISTNFCCDHLVLEDLMFDFLAAVELNGGVEVIKQISGFKEPETVRSDPVDVAESNNNIPLAAEEVEGSTEEFQNRNGDSRGLRDIENVQNDVEFVDMSSSFVPPISSPMEEPKSPVLRGSRAARKPRPAKRSRSSAAASRKANNVAQANRCAAIKRIYARFVEKSMDSSASSNSNEPNPIQDLTSGRAAAEGSEPPSVEKRRRKRFSRTRNSKDDDFESEDSEEENDDEPLPNYVP